MFIVFLKLVLGRCTGGGVLAEACQAVGEEFAGGKFKKEQKAFYSARDRIAAEMNISLRSTVMKRPASTPISGKVAKETKRESKAADENESKAADENDNMDQKDQKDEKGKEHKKDEKVDHVAASTAVMKKPSGKMIAKTKACSRIDCKTEAEGSIDNPAGAQPGDEKDGDDENEAVAENGESEDHADSSSEWSEPCSPLFDSPRAE